MKIFYFFLVFFTFFLFSETKSLEIKILATVNNQTISNYDFFVEIKTQELLNNKIINEFQHKQILRQMIDELIKKVETDNNNITADKNILKIKYNEILAKYPDEVKIDNQIKQNIKFKIENSIKWNNLILTKYRTKIALNKNEIDQIIKSQNLSEEEREKITILEKNKKLSVFSKTHFNQIKKKYFVKYF